MCGCLSKKASKVLGIFLLIGFIVVSLGAFIMAASSSKTFNSKYNPNVLQAYNGYILGCAGIVFLFSFMGIVALYWESRILLIIFQIIWFSLFILTFIVSILALISGSIKEFGGFRCIKDKNATQTTKIDDYFSQVDASFCSDECVCNLKNSTNFPAAIKNKWKIDPVGGPVYFHDCRQAVKDSVYKRANLIPDDLSKITSDKIDMDLFFKTWKWVEETYECTGFCDTEYLNDKNETVKFSKYLFSDINRGQVKSTKGCFHIILDDTIKFFSSNGLYILLASLYMLTVFIIAIAWCCNNEQIEFSPDSQRTVMINPSKY